MKTALLAGLVATGLVGTAYARTHDQPAVHEMTLALPGGGVERIAYVGETPPAVSVLPPAPLAGTFGIPSLAAFFGPDAGASPFTMLDRMAAAMGAQAQAMLQQAAQLSALPAPDRTLVPADLAALPPGTRGFYSVSVIGPDGGACTRTMRFDDQGHGAAPRFASSVSGPCSGASGPAALTEQVPPPAAMVRTALPDGGVAHLTKVRAEGAHPARGMVRDGVWWQEAK